MSTADEARAFSGLRAERRVGRRRARAHTRVLNARPGPTPTQWFGAALVFGGAVAWAVLSFNNAVDELHGSLLTLFGMATLWRLTALALARPAPMAAPVSDEQLPNYTIVAPLLREGAMVGPLLSALDRLDYPRDQLQILLALEWDDIETRDAVASIRLPEHVTALIVPPGGPRTKPRACNVALQEARGEYLVVFDAEDRPDPQQLREAASRFAVAGQQIACLQAPLRAELRGSFTMRQFSLEYAALFEVMLPALARLGAPFPLGGTSNHFRTEVLRSLGGWDAWNVTEDADLGFRLTAAGYRLGVLQRPTYEDPPRGAREWMPQRSRWLKGYMQTWGVHMRQPFAGGLGWFIALQVTVGMSVLSAVIHAPTAVLISLQIIASTTPFGWGVSLPDILLFGGGWGAAVLSMSSGARRAGERARLSDALLAPAYWSLQSVAFWRALHQLVRRPHHWDKTPHHPPEPTREASWLDEAETERVTASA